MENTKLIYLNLDRILLHAKKKVGKEEEEEEDATDRREEKIIN